MRKFFWAMICLIFFSTACNAQAAQSGPPPSVGYMKIFQEINDARGKVVVVNFFATWCGPCMLEIPGLVELRKLYPESEIFIMGISLDTDYGQLRKFLQKNPVNYTVYHADAQVGSIFQVNTIPKMLVYDRQGSLVVNHAGFLAPEQLKHVLDDLIHKNKADNTDRAPAGRQQAAEVQNQQ